MHYLLKNAVRNIIARAEATHILRTDEEAAKAREVARAGRVLLLHEPTNEVVERWIDEHGDHEQWLNHG